MKIEITPEGLSVEIEHPPEWIPIMHIVRDVDQSMATELGGLMEGEEFWEEFVVPELHDFFNQQLATVQKAITAARRETKGGTGGFVIPKNDAEAWYGTLNQAQHALEKKHRFGSLAEVDSSGFSLEKQDAYVRRRFYGAIQEIILQHFLE